MTQALDTITIQNSKGSIAKLTTIGASLMSLKIKLRSGQLREVVLGNANVADYQANPAFMGATVGRFANRIAKGKMERDGKSYQLPVNQGPNHLHGGGVLSHTPWSVVEQTKNEVCFAIHSADGDQGYPGNFKATVSYLLDDEDQLNITYSAEVDQVCPVNMTNHSYFNLNKQHNSVKDHQLWIAADQYLPVSDDGIAEGGLKSVADTGFDFRQAKLVGQDLLSDDDQKRVGGYDHSYLLDPARIEAQQPVARLLASDLQLAMDMYTSKPVVQLYTGNYLQEGALNREGDMYAQFAGLALETQFLPDAPNRPDWPHQSCWLEPGELYQHHTSYRFYQP